MEQAKLLSFTRSSDQNGMRKTRLKDTDQILFNMAACQLQANVIPAAPSTPFGTKKEMQGKTLYTPAPIVQQIGLRTPLSLAIAFY